MGGIGAPVLRPAAASQGTGKGPLNPSPAPRMPEISGGIGPLDPPIRRGGSPPARLSERVRHASAIRAAGLGDLAGVHAIDPGDDARAAAAVLASRGVRIAGTERVE